MKAQRSIILLVQIIICFAVTSCSLSSSSYKDAYEKKSLEEQIGLAMQDNLFAEQGFTIKTYKESITATKRFGEAEVYYTVSPYYGSSGGIQRKADKNTLSIEFYSDYMGIRLTGERFSYLSNTTYDFEPIDYLMPYEDNINLDKILDVVDIKEIKNLCNLYTQITNTVMSDIYKTL